MKKIIKNKLFIVSMLLLLALSSISLILLFQHKNAEAQKVKIAKDNIEEIAKQTKNLFSKNETFLRKDLSEENIQTTKDLLSANQNNSTSIKGKKNKQIINNLKKEEDEIQNNLKKAELMLSIQKETNQLFSEVVLNGPKIEQKEIAIQENIATAQILHLKNLTESLKETPFKISVHGFIQKAEKQKEEINNAKTLLEEAEKDKADVTKVRSAEQAISLIKNIKRKENLQARLELINTQIDENQHIIATEEKENKDTQAQEDTLVNTVDKAKQALADHLGIPISEAHIYSLHQGQKDKYYFAENGKTSYYYSVHYEQGVHSITRDIVKRSPLLESYESEFEVPN